MISRNAKNQSRNMRGSIKRSSEFKVLSVIKSGDEESGIWVQKSGTKKERFLHNPKTLTPKGRKIGKSITLNGRRYIDLTGTRSKK